LDLTQLAYLSQTKMILNVLVAFSVLAAAVSAYDDNVGKVRKDGALHRHIVDSFKSDSFKPVGSSAEKGLQATVYSLTGSIYEYLYFSSNPAVTDPTCSTTPAQSFGAFVNVCNVDHGFSFKLQLTDNSCNGFTVQYFSDMYCRNYIGLSQGYAASGQCRVDPASDPPNAYLISSCTTQAAPMMSSSNVLASSLFYADDCTYSAWGYVGTQLGHCFRSTYNTSQTAEFFSYQCNGAVPTKSIWNDAACSSLNGTEPVTAGCNVLPVTGNDNDEIFNPPPSVSTTAFPTLDTQRDASMFVYCPTNAPTLRPALAQTFYPTLATAQPVSFEVVQGLTGTDAATLTASAVSISTLKTTIAGTMGLTADSIATISVEDYCSDCGRRLSLSSLLHPLASTSVVTMTYVVSATSVYSADNLYWRLNGAVYSGAFNTDLYTNAQAAGATVLYGCTSMVVSYTIDWDFDDDNIGKLNGGAIAGIVIGVLAFVAIVGGLIFYFACRRRPSAPMSSHGAKPAVELNNKA